MKIVKTFCRCFFRQCWLWGGVFVIATAIVLSAARILLPQADRYQVEIEQRVSRLVGQPLVIEDFEVGWHGLGPRLYLKGVKIEQGEGGQTLFSFDQAHVDISLISSLVSGEIDFGTFTLSGLDLKLVRRLDGSLGLEGIELSASGAQKPAAPDQGDKTLEWLWRQGRLAVDESSVQFRDLKTPERVWRFDHVSVQLSNSGNKARLSGRVGLPAELGQELALVLNIERVGRNIADWRAKFYMSAEGIEIGRLLALADLGLEAESGRLGGRLWGGWRDGALVDLRGDVALQGAELSATVALEDGASQHLHQRLSQFSSRFVWKGGADRWRLDIDRLRLDDRANTRAPTRARVEYRRDETGLHVEGGFNTLRLDPIAPLALLAPQLPAKAREALTALAPEGTLANTFFRFEEGADSAPEFFLQTAFEGLGLAAWGRKPGVKGLDGTLNLDRHSGLLQLSTVDAELDSGGLFRQPLPLDSLVGQVAWQRLEEGLFVALRQFDLSNSDARAEANGRLFIPADGASPQISLIAEVLEGDGAMTSRYLPVRVMPPHTVDWLDRAIVAGRLNDATLVLHGPLKRFPFDHGEGRFEVRANVEEGILDYAPGWPRMEQIEAELAFIGRSMEINGERAVLFDTDLSDVRVAIANMRARPVMLTISGRARGGLDDVVSYLDESPPLHKLFATVLSGARASGQSDLRLDLKLPLAKGHTAQVKGETTVSEGALDLSQFGVDLRDIEGTIGFSNDGLSAEGVRATVMGQPAQIDIYGQGENHRNMIFDARGYSRYGALEQRLKSIPVFGYLEGVSSWQALLNVPRQHQSEGQRVSLSIKSDLDGSSVLLPEPLRKAAEEARQIVVEADLGTPHSQWRFNYDNGRLTGLFDVPQGGKLRGELHFAGQAALPERSGLRVAGRLDFFDQKQWWPILFGEQRESGPGVASADDDSGVNQLDVAVKKAEIFGQRFDDVTLVATRAGGVWEARVSSEQLKGRVYLPEDWTLPLKANLDYLYLPEFGEQAGAGESGGAVEGESVLATFDPGILPPLRVESQRLYYGGRGLGRMDLRTEKRLHGLSIEQLKLRSKFAKIDATGAWNYIAGQHNSVLNASLQVDDLGKLIRALGFGKLIAKGHGESNLNLRWSAPLVSMEPMLLNGSADFRFRDGRLLELDPGAGRIFSLLSPRRLLLDFRDLDKGLAFDKMVGRFDIRSGNAFTQNFKLEGPVATIEARGRIGLGAEDYDQEVTVVPHVTSSLPLLGAVVQGSLGAGAVVLLAEQILKPAIDEASTLRYNVTGRWDDPQVTPLDLSNDEVTGTDRYLPEVLRDE